MNREILSNHVADKVGITKADAENAVKTVFEEIGKSLESGEEVSIPAFGKFSAQEKAARTARNPKTGAAIEVPAKKSPKFSPSKSLKDRVAGK